MSVQTAIGEPRPSLRARAFGNEEIQTVRDARDAKRLQEPHVVIECAGAGAVGDIDRVEDPEEPNENAARVGRRVDADRSPRPESNDGAEGIRHAVEDGGEPKAAKAGENLPTVVKT